MRRTGFVLICATIVAAGVISVRGSNADDCCGSRTIYDLGTWWLIVLAGSAALLVRVARRPRVLSVGGAIALCIGPQIVGAGLVAHRRWFTSAGFYNGPDRNIVEIRQLALLLALVGVVTTIAGSRVLWTHGRRLAQEISPNARRVAFIAAGGIALTLPYWIGHGRPGSMTTTALGAHALMYSLPWGLALAATTWLHDWPARIVGIVIPMSALPFLGEQLMIWAYHPTTGFGVACIGGAAIVLTRWPHGEVAVGEAASVEFETISDR